MSLHLRHAKLNGRISVEQFALERGECVVICGPNGSGKSSLLRLLGALHPPDAGSLHMDGKEAQRLPIRERAALVAWLPQRAEAIEAMPARQLVAAARYRFSESEQNCFVAADQALQTLGLLHLADRLTSAMSGGELQRVLLASLIAQDAPLLLVDEPANHLDPKHQVETYKRLGELWQGGRGLAIVSHDVRLAALLGPADKIRVVGIREGSVAWECSFAAPELPALLSELYQVPFVEREHHGALAVDLERT